MVKICQTGLQKLNFEILPKKRIFRFLPKISAGHGWSWKFFFANFQILGPLGCQVWVVIPQIVKKRQNHCTLMEKLIEPNDRQSRADIILYMFESTNAGFSLIPCERKTSVLRVIIASLLHFLKQNPASCGNSRAK
jgi:hypothetical protein